MILTEKELKSVSLSQIYEYLKSEELEDVFLNQLSDEDITEAFEDRITYGSGDKLKALKILFGMGKTTVTEDDRIKEIIKELEAFN